MKVAIRSIVSVNVNLNVKTRIPESILSEYINQVLTRTIRKRFSSGRMERYFGSEAEPLTEERIRDFLDSLEEGIREDDKKG